MDILERLLQRKEKPQLALKRAKALLEAMHDETLRHRLEHKKARERARAREDFKHEALAAAARTRPNVHVTGSNIYQSFNVTNADAYHDQSKQHYAQGPAHLPQSSLLPEETPSVGEAFQDCQSTPPAPKNNTRQERPRAVTSKTDPLAKKGAPTISPDCLDAPSSSPKGQALCLQGTASVAGRGNANECQGSADKGTDFEETPPMASTSLQCEAEAASLAPFNATYPNKTPGKTTLGVPAKTESTSQMRVTTEEPVVGTPSNLSNQPQPEEPSPAELKAETTSAYDYQFKNPLFSHTPTRKVHQKPHSAIEAVLSAFDRNEWSNPGTATSSGTSNKSPKRKATQNELIRILLELGASLKMDEDGFIKILNGGRKRRRLSEELLEYASDSETADVAARAPRSTVKSDNEEETSPSSNQVPELPPASLTLPSANGNTSLDPVQTSPKKSATRPQTSIERDAVSTDRVEGSRPGIGRFRVLQSAIVPPTPVTNPGQAGELSATENGQEQSSPAPETYDSLCADDSQQKGSTSTTPAADSDFSALSLLKDYGSDDDDDDDYEDEGETAKVGQQSGSLKMRPHEASEGKEGLSRDLPQPLNDDESLSEQDGTGPPSSKGLRTDLASQLHLGSPEQTEETSESPAEKAAVSFNVQQGETEKGNDILKKQAMASRQALRNGSDAKQREEASATSRQTEAEESDALGFGAQGVDIIWKKDSNSDWKPFYAAATSQSDDSDSNGSQIAARAGVVARLDAAESALRKITEVGQSTPAAQEELSDQSGPRLAETTENTFQKQTNIFRGTKATHLGNTFMAEQRFRYNQNRGKDVSIDTDMDTKELSDGMYKDGIAESTGTEHLGEEAYVLPGKQQALHSVKEKGSKSRDTKSDPAASFSSLNSDTSGDDGAFANGFSAGLDVFDPAPRSNLEVAETDKEEPAEIEGEKPETLRTVSQEELEKALGISGVDELQDEDLLAGIVEES